MNFIALIHKENISYLQWFWRHRDIYQFDDDWIEYVQSDTMLQQVLNFFNNNQLRDLDIKFDRWVNDKNILPIIELWKKRYIIPFKLTSVIITAAISKNWIELLDWWAMLGFQYGKNN